MKCMVNMKIYEVKERTELLMEQLLKVWEESVRATHQFLSEKEIEKIKEYVPQALAAWKCCSFPKKKEEKALENNCFYTGSRITG